jgi:NhaA family Na+:H+ antiporter
MSDRLTAPLLRFVKIEAVAGALLFFAAALALVIANSSLSGAVEGFWTSPLGVHFGSWEFTRTVREWINEGLMTIFFFVIALELKRELILGELHSFRFAALPLAGALGGMMVPAAIFLLVMDGREGWHGWGVVMETDTAFVVAALALFGQRIPAGLRLFLLSLAIFDDVGAIFVVAVAYNYGLNVIFLLLACLVIVATWATARIGIRFLPAYCVLGILLWLLLDLSGIHPTVAGVVLGLMTPTGAWVSDERLHAILGKVLAYPRGQLWRADTSERRDLGRARVAATEAISPVERLEMVLHPWASFGIMPLFALANAGIKLVIPQEALVTIAVASGLAVGKPIGVIAISLIAVKLGVAHKPAELTWPAFAAGSILTGMGFTMSLFIADQGFSAEMLPAAKLGILVASSFCAVFGVAALLLVVAVERRKREAGAACALSQ